MSRRRRGNADELVTIYWRDIPAQVTATKNGEKGSWLLDERFQVAIDRAASVAGLTDDDDYVREWRRATQPCSGPAQASAEAEAHRLMTDYPADRLRALIERGGLEAAALSEQDSA